MPGICTCIVFGNVSRIILRKLYFFVNRLLYDMQKWDQTIDHLTIALDLSKNKHANSHWLLARVYMELHKFDLCSQHFKHAIAINDKNPLFRCDFMLFYIESKQFNECLQEMKKYKLLNIKYSYFDLIYSLFIAKQGKVEQAMKNFALLLKQCPEDNTLAINSRYIYLYYYAWLNHYILGEYNESMKYYGMVVELRPMFALAYYHYCVCIISKYIFVQKSKSRNMPRMSSLLRMDIPEQMNDTSVSAKTGNLLSVVDDQKVESSESDDEQMKIDFQMAWKLLQKAKELNDKLPLIVQYFVPLKNKIQKIIPVVMVVGDDEKVDIESSGVRIVIGNIDVTDNSSGSKSVSGRLSARFKKAITPVVYGDVLEDESGNEENKDEEEDNKIDDNVELIEENDVNDVP